MLRWRRVRSSSAGLAPFRRTGAGALVAALLTLVCTACPATHDGGADARGGADAGAGAGLDGGGSPGADASPPLRDDALEPPPAWRELAERTLDSETLAAGLAAAGEALPSGAFAFAARVEPGVGGPALHFYDVEGGAFRRDFWPASTIKLIAALGALDVASSHGVSGSASVSYDGLGLVGTLRELYTDSIVESSNLAYTRTLQIAGFDRINQQFLSPENGLGGVVLQRSYVSGVGVRDVPAMTLEEGGISAELPAQSSDADYGCTFAGRPDGNCADLFELTDALRRVVLHDEIAEAQRFDLTPEDQGALRAALCAAPSFLKPGAERVLGPVSACNKPGWVPSPGYHYLDHAFLEADSGERLFLGAVVPYDSGCSDHTDCSGKLADVAEDVLGVLAGAGGGVPVQPDAGVAIPVQVDPGMLTLQAEGADRVEVYLDGERLGSDEGGPRFSVSHGESGPDPRLLTVRAIAGGEPIGHRAVRVILGGAP